MKKGLLLIAAIMVSQMVISQKLKVEQGDFDFFEGLDQINVEFIYDNMTLYKDNRSNEEYMAERSAELEEKTRGSGKTWEKKWIGSRDLIYEPKFLELMNRYLEEDEGLYFGEDLADAQITLLVETVWVYPGWNAAVMRQPAKLSTNLKFVESGNRSNVLLEISAKNAPGNRFGGTFSNEDRIGEGYAKTGKSVGKLIRKKGF
ncbi:hypothetical protein [Altibacter sp. HG106]|uniref:hypothetical protein n=1 Tax=Altibacter sp. HG106 TaxID=3023937 RepID=UPI00234FCE6E|nr:hypothetical protein [Altibacter sp. HG106]MDC7994710.1 hypothetical protein [Altibacter sp. HG106]